MDMTRKEILKRLKDEVAKENIIVGAGAGTGISAKSAEAGADILVAHMGLTTKGTIGAKTALSLDDAVKRVQEICDAGKSVNPDIMVICHGGPIAMPEDAKYVIERTKGIVGFFGASSIERIPTETAIRDQVREFKMINI